MIIYRSEEKNRVIKKQKGLGGYGFEDVQEAIKQERILDFKPHFNQAEYPGQSILIVQIDRYAWSVPCVKHENGYFLKTMYPDRKATELYLSNY